MTTCPWYVSAHAVRRWQEIEPEAPRDFDDASDAFIEVCAEIWQSRYSDNKRAPRITSTGAYQYEAGRTHGRIYLIVSAKPQPEGGKHQVVDVVRRGNNGR